MKAVKTWVLIFLLLILAINVYAWPIPDTGQTKCYNNTAAIPCPTLGEPFYGQDGNYTINPPSYTKLDASGNALTDNAANWVMVRDNVTGLVWENKTSDGTLHDGSKTFFWCDTNPATNGGNQGTCRTGTGNAATDTEAYLKALNDVNFGGFSDWRMPNVLELGSIRDMRTYYPGINTTWFTSTGYNYHYWSSTTYSSGYAWGVPFYLGGEDYTDNKSSTNYVRAVRGEQPRLDHFVINGGETVTDTNTGLMWQQGTPPETMIWEAALTYAEGLSLAGYDDWRLPTLKELQSIVDYNHFNPAIDTTLFPEMVLSDYWSSNYWSSTTYAYITTTLAWSVSFYKGTSGVSNGDKAGTYYAPFALFA